ncbi:uncharacterized protein LOC126683474 [Mercurialis annua]|uniref:uncharacterized protein LOC126683474 n=1 Tax=Mercurialis annua TaxID=3986 RepID=UPI0024AD319C|nr:uncharacterized protein LOC126683474 [Mercurialis annua]
MATEQPKEEDTAEANDSIDLDVQLMDTNVRSPIDGENVRTVDKHMVSGDNYDQSIDLNVRSMDTNVGYPVNGESVRTASDYCNQSIDLDVLPTINASPGQNFSGSSRSSIANSVRGFSDMQNIPDGFSRVGANERRRQDQNFAAYYSPIPSRQTDRQSIPTPSRGMLEPVRQRADCSLDRNDKRIQSFPTSSPMPNFINRFGVPNGPLFQEIRPGRYPNANCYTNFQGFPNSSSVPIPNFRNQVGAPNARITQNLLMGFPESSSSSATIAQHLQNTQFRTFRNFSPQPSAISPFMGFTRNRPLLEQSAAQHIQADTSAAQAAQVANIGPLGMNIGVRPASNHDMSRALFDPSAILSRPVHTIDQEMPAVNLPTLPLGFSPGPSLRSNATTHSSNTRKVQLSKSRFIRPSGHPSSLRPQMFNIPRSLPSPSVNWPPDSLLEVIKADYVEPMGLNCYICKRDLSFSPEGTIENSELRTPTAVLPCGHHFHGSCLEKITPEAQAHDPPCIACVMDHKD